MLESCSLSTPVLPFTTAGLRPELFTGTAAQSLSRTILAIALSVLVLVGFGFRLQGLSSEGLSEDELNKLNAVADYRAHGLTSANGEHPLLMKALLTISVVAAEKWNRGSIGASHPDWQIPIETALRIPGALFGALSVFLIFLVASELFGVEVALIAAALTTFDPLTIGFNRIAKEDTFLIFFFLLANFFWLRGQRAAENRDEKRARRYYWATAAAFGAMLASKLVPVLIAIPVAYNYAFQKIPVTRWVIGKKRFIKFFALVGIVFVILSPTILLPGTWKAMSSFTSYQRMGHDSYEFMGRLYPHRFTDWLRGEPWYFYLVLVATKLPPLSLISFATGLTLLFRRKTGDGRLFLLLWFALWALAFMFVGGKFTRYVTSVLPAVLMTAAVGVQFIARKFGSLCGQLFRVEAIKVYGAAALASLVIISSFWAAAYAAPHYRLYTNTISGGSANAGHFFPQDEFYDAYIREAVQAIAKQARPGACVASELPAVATYYSPQVNRADLCFTQLSDPSDLPKLGVGDFVIDGRGRTYFSNQQMLTRLRQASRPAFTISVGMVPAADVYVLDEGPLRALRGE